MPTAPKNLPVVTLGVNSSNRSRCLLNSSTQTAIFSPNVIGTAACPWVRPSITVSLSLSAKSHMVANNFLIVNCCRIILSLICNATAESTMSLLVAPRCIHHPASPAASAIAFVRAIMSCLVSLSISSTRSAVTISGTAISATLS